MEDQELIRDQMENTRNALSEKLETLEDRVTATVQGASQDVAQTVETVTDSVQDTVATVKETIDDTLLAVQEGVGAVKSLFDIPGHVERYPWLAVGGSLLLGYFVGEFLLSGRRRDMSKSLLTSSPTSTESSRNGQQNGYHHEAGVEAGHQDGLLERLKPEIAQLKGLALGALMGTVREMITNATGHTNLSHSVSEIIDNVTEKIGGTPVPSEPDHAEEELTPAASV